MKVALFVMYDVNKITDIAKVSDQIMKTPGRKVLANYLFQGKPFDGIPPNTVVAMSVADYESNEVLAAVQYPIVLAGATCWAVPVFEVPIAGAEKTVKKLKK